MAISRSNRATAGAFGAHLRDARQTLGWSQRELAGRSGLPQSQISKIETGEVDPQVSTLVELARSLDLDVQFVPRGAVGAVETVVRQAKERRDRRDVDKGLEELSARVGRVVRARPQQREAADLQQALAALRLEADVLDSETARYGLREALARLNDLGTDGSDSIVARAFGDIRRIVDGLRVAHQRAPARPRPAYSLDDEDDA